MNGFYDHKTIATVHSVNHEQDGEFIVRCVNNHKSLLEALKDTERRALELIERAEHIDALRFEHSGGKKECDLGEVTRMQAQLSRNRALIVKAETE
jgi:hypothetical protein